MVFSVLQLVSKIKIVLCTIEHHHCPNYLTKPININNEWNDSGNPTDFLVHASECEERVKCGLYVAFDGPEKPDIEFEHFKDGNIGVTYLPTVPGV